MDESLIDEEMRRELHYRLIMVKYTNTDPLIEAYMLYNLKKAYDRHNIKMSDKMKTFIAEECKKISVFLAKSLDIKKKEYDSLLEQKNYNRPVVDFFSEEELKRYTEDD